MRLIACVLMTFLLVACVDTQIVCEPSSVITNMQKQRLSTEK
jgi:hypothetical protein